MIAQGKVTAEHLQRSAYLYVRQSSLHQVHEHRESTARQYELKRHAQALGWNIEQLIVIDEDQGLSGASAVERSGFQRMVAEVGLGRVGVVMGLEVSRLARNSADWHRHEFSLTGKRYGEPNPEDEESAIDERMVRLRDLPLTIGVSIGYEYDFGDHWRHQLVLEKTMVPNPEGNYSACIAGARNAPPEDVGGAGGYAEFLETIADPDYKDHDAILKWAGGHFDPSTF